MPVSYRIDRTLGTIHTTCSGEVTFQEVVDHFRRLERDTDCPERLHVLLDLTECTSIPESTQLRSVGSTMDRVMRNVRFDACAIVAGGDLMFGMARMFLVFAEGQFTDTQVFRNVSDAEQWLAGSQPG